MARMNRQFLLLGMALVLVWLVGSQGALAQVSTYQGTFPDGATYIIQVPSNWNGTLMLYSHGYIIPGGGNPAYDVGDAVIGNYLLGNGFALGGSSYASSGWAIKEAIPDQISVLDTFNQLVGKPKRTIAWGTSMGGMVTAALVQRHPERFDGALPMCGIVGGGVGWWNLFLDIGASFNTFFGAGSGLQVIGITDPLSNLTLAQDLITNAQNTAAGQARIALVAALGDVPGWLDPGYPPPPPTDYADREINQFVWLYEVDFLFEFYLRGELEGRTHGNASWDDKIDFKKELERSVDYDEVEALYQEAGLSLDADLETLSAAPRFKADPKAVDYLKDNIIFNGDLKLPVLSLHTKGDGLVFNQNESAYHDAVRDAKKDKYLRQAWVDRAGHCAFTDGEVIVALQALINRLDTRKWNGLGPNTLNNEANALGSSYNAWTPSYARFNPAPFLREYNAGKHKH